jgi:hypothetical protein
MVSSPVRPNDANTVQAVMREGEQRSLVFTAKNKLQRALWKLDETDLLTAWVIHKDLTVRYIDVAGIVDGHTFPAPIYERL